MSDQSATFGTFLCGNMRWLTGGILLTFFASFGQTFFISLFAGQIRSNFGLTHGAFGLYYMMATLGSAFSLIWLGRLIDSIAVARLAMGCIIALASAAVLISVADSAFSLILALYLLRLFGQGMLTHTSMVAMGRWFHAERGRAVSVATIGHQIGEGLLPLAVVGLLIFMDWRSVWFLSAVLLIILALPLSHVLLSRPRMPTRKDRDNFERGRQWTRPEVLRDLPFWAVCTGVFAPAFIGTSVFFHQVHLAEIKQWSLTVIASSFALLSITSVSVGLVTGQLIDRYSARSLLPFFLFPLSLGCAVLGAFDGAWAMPVFMVLLGSSYGISSVVFGAIWPETYGTRHLGAVRSVVSAAMVFASALGPGLTGWLIDQHIGFEQQLLAMSVYCTLMILVLFSVSRILKRRAILI
ncbi:MFS transporter [Granulosicoccus sp.]|nr:MFS transporter [Granulosicoccus sp.]